MKTPPKVFCPSCGVPWHKAAEPSPTRKTKIPTKPKPEAVTNVVQDKPVKKTAVKKTTVKKKKTTKKGSR